MPRSEEGGTAMNKVSRVALLVCALAAILPCGFAQGAVVSQTLTLRPGWNAVFLEVEPSDAAPSIVFAGVTGLEGVWAWNHHASSVEYVQDPGLPIDPPPYMLAYLPGNSLISNLHAIRGETAYLIKVASGAPPVQLLTIKGQPAIPKVEWVPNSFNLVGFHLDGTLAPPAMPTYFDFFAGSPAHYVSSPSTGIPGPEAYVLDNPTGTWRRVVSTDRMSPGESFWVYCKGSSSFAGPLSVQLEQAPGLDFGSVLDQQVVTVRNDHTTDRTAVVRALTGAARLHYWVSQPDLIIGVWQDLLSANPVLAIPAGSQSRLRLGVVRAGLLTGMAYEDNVEIRDGQGVRILLPATVQGVSTAGLWVGSVVAGKVTDNGSGAGAPTPVGTPFVFKIILHVSDDPTPTVRLLREVVQLWQEGSWKPDPDNLGHLIVDQPGHFVLVGNPALLATDPPAVLRGAALRDGQEVGRRISTAAFGFTTPVVKSGGSFAPGDTLTFNVTRAPDDSTNPFLHQYNKDHAAAQSYEVTRTLRLQFLVDDPVAKGAEGVPLLGWGSNEVGGIFSETIGLRHASPANPSQPDAGDASYHVGVEGTFRLRRVSDVGQLLL